MTTTESRFFDTAERIRAIHDNLPDGIDPDFDASDLADLVPQFADHHFTLQRD